MELGAHSSAIITLLVPLKVADALAIQKYENGGTDRVVRIITENTDRHIVYVLPKEVEEVIGS